MLAWVGRCQELGCNLYYPTLMRQHPALQATGQYLFSKPRVQEIVLADEAKRMLNNAEESARAKGHALYPESDAVVPGTTMSAIANKAVNEKMQGSTSPVPGPLKSMMSDDDLKRLGAIDTGKGSLLDIYTKMGSDAPTSVKDVQGYYSELGKLMSKGNLDGDIYASVKQAHGDLGNLLNGIFKSEGKGPQWEDAQANWRQTAQDWWDKDSPLAQSMKESDPKAILKPLIGDQAERATQLLNRYTEHGANPSIVKAATNLYKGMDRMKFQGLFRAAGPLLLATYMARAEGVPYNASMAALVPIILGKMGMGYFQTRPSLTQLLSGEAPKVPGEGWIPRSALINKTPFPGVKP